MRLLILLLVLSKLIFAQFDSTMYDLIRTTYERSFDRPIVFKYLNSNLGHKTKAAILSIAQSEDSSFVPELLKLNFNEYGGDACFALAQIGACNQSIKFLWKYLYSSPLPNQYLKIFFAIGKIGDEKDLNKLVEFYNSFDGPISPYEGISEAILQFQIRGIKSDNAKLILENEVTHKLSSDTRIAKALFTLIRYGGSTSILNFRDYLVVRKYENGLKQQLDNIDIVKDQFYLMNLSIIKRFSLNDYNNFYQFTKPEFRNDLILINLAKTQAYFDPLKDENDLGWNENYIHFLYDENQNVAIQSAISIKNLNKSVVNLFSTLIKNKIDSLLYNKANSGQFYGELFLSRYELFGGYDEHEKMLNELELPNKYQIQLYAKNPNKEIAFNKLFEFYSNSLELKDKIESLNQILEIKSDPKYIAKFNQILVNSLNSNHPPLISITADGMDSLLITPNEHELKLIIENQISEHKDNPDFLEATMSLINLSEKIDNDFYELIIEKVKTSKLFSIRKFAATKTGNKQIGFKELDKFEEIWSSAFNYKQATVTTSKGKIVIEFNSEIAPISVGNFCMLAVKNFYNGIVFHRVVPGFVIQAGDPTATGWGGPGYDIVSEFSNTDFGIGYVGMASSGKDTEGSQFFIMQGSHPHLDSRYTLFAKVIEGMNVVYNITEDDKIIGIELK